MVAKDVKKKENVKPIVTFRAGQVTSSVWKKAVEVNKKMIDFYSVTIQKNYKDKEEEWNTTSTFNREDLIKVEIVTRKASEYIYLKEDAEEVEE